MYYRLHPRLYSLQVFILIDEDLFGGGDEQDAAIAIDPTVSSIER